LKNNTALSGSNDNIIIIENVHKRFGEVVALDDVSLNIKRGEVCLIFGPSGGGKSTLLRCINHLEIIDSGSIIVDGIPLIEAKENIDQVRAEVGIVFQLFNLFPHLTSLENITLAQKVVRKRSREESEQVARDLLKRVHIPEKADVYPNQLSGGQKQRVAIARALAMNPKIMLFDEPTSALDPEMIKEVLDVMLDLCREGMTMVVVSHEMGFAKAAADKMVFLADGRIVEEGSVDELFNNPKTDRTQEFLDQILE
jgi:polar amino acid transport system ATP-binding protein